MATSAGIDIGADALKAVVLSGGGKGPVEILSAGTMPLGELGLMADGEDKTLAIGLKLKDLVKGARIKANRRRLSVSGGGAGVRYLQVPPVPPWRLDMLVAYEVQERAGDDKEDPNTYDYHILDVPEVNGQNTVMIGLLKETAARDYLGMARAAGAGEVEIDLEAVSLYSAYYHGHGFDSDKTVLVCDIGAEDITVLLCKNGALYFARTVLGGGRRFTQVLADELKIEASEAEQIKKTQGEINFDAQPPAATAARSTLGRRVPGATNILPRAGNTNVLPRPGLSASAPGIGNTGASGVVQGIGPIAGTIAGPMGGRADASAARPAPLRAPSQAAQPAQPAQPAQEKTAPPEKTAGMQKASELGISEPGALNLSLDPSFGLENDTLPPNAPTPKPVVEAPKAVAPKAPTTSAAAENSIALEPVGPPPFLQAGTPLGQPADLSLDLDLQPVPEASHTHKGGTQGASAPTAPVAPVVPVAPVAPVGSGPAPKTEAAPAPASLDLDLPGLPSAGSPGSEAKPEAKAAEVSPDAEGAEKAAVQESPDQRKRQISGALLREAAAICAALENSVQVSKAQMKLRELKIDRVYVTGGCSQLKGLSEFIARRMRVEVLPLEPMKQISTTRLPAEQAAALKAEQHSLAVAIGAALTNLNLPGTFSFLLWPEAVKQRKVFWGRGAYLYYSAALVAVALGLVLYTPWRNTEALRQNFERAEAAVGNAMIETKNKDALVDTNEELYFRNKQIVDNTLSGDFFLGILAELKDTRRISEDVWLTQVSTQLPQVIRTLNSDPTATTNTRTSTKSGVLRDAANATDDTFQTQRRIYLRGFVRGPQDGEQRIKGIRDFYSRLVPHPNEPDHPDNLFKDIRILWISPGDNKQGAFYLTEFVLEAYTEGTAKREDTATKPVVPGKGTPAPAKGVADATTVRPTQPAQAGQPIAQPGAQAAPNGVAAPVKAAEKEEAAPPKKKKFITGGGPGDPQQ